MAAGKNPNVASVRSRRAGSQKRTGSAQRHASRLFLGLGPYVCAVAGDGERAMADHGLERTDCNIIV